MCSLISAETSTETSSEVKSEKICGSYEVKSDITIFDGAKKIKEVSAGIAKTPAEFTKGLQDCMFLPPDKGLLFIFESPRVTDFWMDKTHIPLAIIFIDESGKIVAVKKGEPMSKALIPSEKPVKFVLELNWKDASGIKAGNTVKLR